VFVPKTLSPEATDDSSVRIAVITPITEKTPMVIPRSVSIDRSLLSRIASNAILKLSLNVFLKWDVFLFTIMM
jgi:hypothetical protein